MCIFKKIFSKFKKKKEQEVSQEECWYNNAHESAERNLGEPMEATPTSANWLDFATVNQIKKK